MEAINTLRTVLTSCPVLKFFNPVLPTRLSADSSSYGLGALLEQQHATEWHPVAYASRLLTSAEQNYCQLEKETLSIVFGCERFKEYLHGRNFEVLNDHQPLKSIFTKPLSKSPPRLQRFLLRLQQYRFTMHYLKGSKLVIPYTLSRASLPDTTPEIPENELSAYVHSILSEIPISKTRLAQFATETANDATLQQLKTYVQAGWPNIRIDIDPSVHPFYNFRDQISVHNGLLLNGQRIIVPLNMRKEIKSVLHTSHVGIERTKARARESLFWPNINNDITEMIKNCTSCQHFQNRQPAETPLSHDVPTTPWCKVGTDLFSFRNKDYLIIADYTSKFFDISQLDDTSASTVILRSKRIFSKFAIPKIVESDNGPQFSSFQYKSFSSSWDFEHITSSPEYPQSNSFIERQIQTVKKTLNKAFHNSDDPYLALLALRTTPHSAHQPSPAARLMNRELRTILPRIGSNVQLPKRLTSTPQPQHTSPPRNLPPLNIRDTVCFRENGVWGRKGKVIEKCPQPRSYKIQADKGTIIRRNRRHLLHTKDSEPCSQEYI